MTQLKQFTRVYPISKTLRFELKPIGKTLEFIKGSGLLEQDKHRAESYVKVKDIIDEYHKSFIDSALDEFSLECNSKGQKNSLEEFYFYYMSKSKDEAHKLNFETVQKNLRKQIAESFTKKDNFNRIYKKELIKEDLVNFVTEEKDRALINEFRDFTTYFTGSTKIERTCILMMRNLQLSPTD